MEFPEEKSEEKIVCDCGRELSHMRYLESARPNGKGHRATRSHLNWLESQVSKALSRSRLEGYRSCTLQDIATHRQITDVETMDDQQLIKAILATNPKKKVSSKRSN